MSKENKYALLYTDVVIRDEVTKQLDHIINAAAKKIAGLYKRYPHSGIGDTATDEEIASALYSRIH